MPVSTKQFTVDGDEYEITSLGAKKGRKIWLKLVTALAPAMRELSKQGSTLTEQVVLAALAAAIEHLDDDITEALYEAYGETCTVRIPETGNTPNLTGAVFDQHFSKRYVAMSKWLWECTRFNFASFLDDTSLGSMTNLLRQVGAGVSARKSQTVSTGSSGES